MKTFMKTFLIGLVVSGSAFHATMAAIVNDWLAVAGWTMAWAGWAIVLSHNIKSEKGWK